MTNNEIFQKALDKINNSTSELYIPNLIVDRKELYDYEIYFIIFSHEFAKALWGDVHLCGYCGKGFCYAYDCCGDDCQLGSNYPFPIKKWEYYLQQMVLEKEPLKYLEKFL